MKVTAPHSPSLSCQFTVWSVLYQYFSFFSLLTTLGDHEQQGCGLILSGFLPEVFEGRTREGYGFQSVFTCCLRPDLSW